MFPSPPGRPRATLAMNALETTESLLVVLLLLLASLKVTLEADGETENLMILVR